MRRSRHDFHGTGQVFSFTLTQLLKNKANMISLIIMFLFSLASIPLMTLTGTGQTDGTGKSELSVVYIKNETGYEMKAAEKDERFAETEFRLLGADERKEVSDLGEYEALVNIFQDEDGFYCAEVRAAADSAAESDDLRNVQDFVLQWFDWTRYQASGVTQEQMDLVMTPVYGDVTAAADFEDATESSFGIQYTIQFIYSIVMMMMSVFSISYIIQTVVEEKSSKLVELLMVSVRPLALIVGKILAAMVYVCILFAAICAGGAMSVFITGLLAPSSDSMGVILQSFDLTAESGNLLLGMVMNPVMLPVILISLVIGYLTFALLSGLAGTGCSETEDMQRATMSPMLIVMGCYLIACIVPAFESKLVSMLVSLIPFVSIFCAPAQYMLGNISFPVLAVSWLIQILVLSLLAWFAAGIYESLLMHRGGRVTFMKMLKMAVSKEGKSSERKEAERS